MSSNFTVINANPKSFDKALEKAISIFNKKGDKEVTLSLSSGTYDFNQTITFDASTFPGKNSLRIVANSNRRPVFSSLVNIPSSEFKKVDGKPYYVYSFEKGADGKYPDIRTFYNNGKIIFAPKSKGYVTAPPFQTPEKSYTKEDGMTPVFNETHKLYVPIEAINDIGEKNCIDSEIHFNVEWEYKIYHIAKIDTNDSYTHTDGKKYVALYVRDNEIDGGNPNCISRCFREFFIYGGLVNISPNTFVYIPSEGKLYFYPETDMDKCSIAYGKTIRFFEFNNFESVSIKGVDFTGLEDCIFSEFGYYAPGQAGRWTAKYEHGFGQIGAINVLNINGLNIDDCTFTNLPGAGISLVGNLENINIINSRFTSIGATAIQIGKANVTCPPRALYSDSQEGVRNVRIENNFLKDIAFTYQNCPAITVTPVDTCKILHNTIIDCAYTGISVGWYWLVYGWNEPTKSNLGWHYGERLNVANAEIAFNYITGFMYKLQDGGAIYTLGGNAPTDNPAKINSLHDNYIVENENTCPHNGLFMDIYHDGGSSSWYTYNNVVIHDPAKKGIGDRCYCQQHPLQFTNALNTGFKEQSVAWNILIENNYFVGCKTRDDVFKGWCNSPAELIVDNSRNIFDANTHLIPNKRALKKHPDALFIIKNAGCKKSVIKK